MSDFTEKEVDESWKNAAEAEKVVSGGQNKPESGENKIVVDDFEKQQDDPKEEAHEHGPDCGCGHDQADETAEEQEFELTFLNYITSLGFQVMIFLGEVPHPATNETEKNLDQAKLIIDTLAMLKEKTAGNLNEQEENMLNATVYELQLKYVETIKKENSES